MGYSALVKKRGGALWPVTIDDKEELRGIGQDEVYRCEFKKRSGRSVRHNALYWSGLLELALQYWTPTAGCLSPAEEDLLAGFSIYLNKLTDGSGWEGLEKARLSYMDAIKRKRAIHYEMPAKAKNDIHKWIKEELGYYDLVLTPGGWKKELKSTNFEMMGQERFNEFYKNAFNIVWNFILSQHFETREQADNAVEELLRMG